MNKLAIILIAVLTSVSSFAQIPAPATFIKGDLQIKYLTRTQLDCNKPKEGIEDVYTLNVNVSNSAQFKGTINQLPYIKGIVNDQKGRLTYAVDLDVVNPANPVQTRNVGKLTGVVPVDEKNVYSFTDGSLKVSVFPMGNAKGFDSTFKGIALGKPPGGSEGLFAKLKKDGLSFSKLVNGKKMTIEVTKYDQMVFQSQTVAAGPVQIYPEATVNGTFTYDYERTAWYLQNVIVTYPVDGRLMQDTLTGNIRWLKASNEYEFDIRVNEAPPTEAAIFSGPSVEADFFASDSAIPALTGTMKYKDTIIGDTVIASAVAINLTGNKLTKQQTMYLAKVLFLSSIVPLNAE